MLVSSYQAKAQNYYVGQGESGSGSKKSAPIYIAPQTSNNRGSSSPILLNQMIDGSYQDSTSRSSTSRYSSRFNRGGQQYSLGQTPEQIASKRARADADERERQREADAQRRLIQAQQTQDFKDQIGNTDTNATSQRQAQTQRQRVYRYSPVNNDITTPQRVFNSLR